MEILFGVSAALGLLVGGIQLYKWLRRPPRAKSSASDDVFDVRVGVQVALAPDHVRDDMVEYFVVAVANHSDKLIFLSNVVLDLVNDRSFLLPRDSLTGDPQGRRRLEPGDRFDFHIAPDVIWQKVGYGEVVNVSVTDQLGHVYRGPGSEVQKVLEVLWKAGKDHERRHRSSDRANDANTNVRLPDTIECKQCREGSARPIATPEHIAKQGYQWYKCDFCHIRNSYNVRDGTW